MPAKVSDMPAYYLTLSFDELEALRLADLFGLYHEEAASEMGISRATFGRIVEEARRKIADALVNGKALVIEGGNFDMKVENEEPQKAGRRPVSKGVGRGRCRQGLSHGGQNRDPLEAGTGE